MEIVSLDLLTYAGNLANLYDVQEKFGHRYTFIKGDVADRDLVLRLFADSDIETMNMVSSGTTLNRVLNGQ